MNDFKYAQMDHETDLLNMESRRHKSDHEKITNYTDISHGEDCKGDNIDLKPSNEACTSSTIVQMPSVEKDIPPSTVIVSPFIHGISNKMTTPLPPLSGLPWLSNIKPLPPFESLLPPNITGATQSSDTKSSAMKSSHISVPLKDKNVSTVNTPTEKPKDTMTYKEKLSKSLFKSKHKGKESKMGHFIASSRKSSKKMLSISEGSMSSSSSLSVDSSSSSSSSSEEEPQKHSRSKNNHLVVKKQIPKYGQTKSGTPVNYEIIGKALPNSNIPKSLKSKSSEIIEADNFCGLEIPLSYKDVLYPKISSTHQKYQLEKSNRNISPETNSNLDEELLYYENLKKTNYYSKNDSYTHGSRKNRKRYISSSSTNLKYSSKDRSETSDYTLCETAYKYSDRSNRNNSKSSSKKKCSHTNDSRRHEYKYSRHSYLSKHQQYKKPSRPNKYTYEDESEYDSCRESGECSSSSDTDSDDEMECEPKRSEGEYDHKIAKVHDEQLYDPEETWVDGSDIYSPAESNSKVCKRNSHLDDDEGLSPLSDYRKEYKKTIPLNKRLGIPTDDTSNSDSDSDSSFDNNHEKPRFRKGPHTPDYPYEKSPQSVITTEVEKRDSVDKGDCDYNIEIKQPSVITKSNSSIKGSSCNFTTNHYKPTYSGDKTTNMDRFAFPRQESVLTHNINSGSSLNACKGHGQVNVKESPVRSNLDARIKTMFGVKNSSSEDSPIKMDSSIAKPKIFKPLRNTPSPFRSRNTYLHWYKETYRIKKIGSNHSYSTVDPSERLKIGIQIKEYSEDFVSDQEQPSDSVCTLQDLGISPPRFNRVQQILNFDDAEGAVDNALTSKKTLINNVVKMDIGSNTELELHFGSNSQKDQECTKQSDNSASHLMDLVVAKLLNELKTSLKREISEDAINLALTDQFCNKKPKIN